MSEFKDAVETLIAKIHQGNGSDQETKDAVAELGKRLDANDATDAEIQAVVLELATKLADSTPVTPPVPTLPVLAELSISSGSPAGGESITLTGTGFTGATAINFGDVAGTDLAVTSDTASSIVAPAHDAGAVDVTIVTPAGTSEVVLTGVYTYA